MKKITLLWVVLVGLCSGWLHADPAEIVYVDASPENTRAVDAAAGAFFSTEAKVARSGSAWFFREGFGFSKNGIYEKISGEATPLVTTISGLSAGQRYAVYVNFLSVPSESWRVRAGISSDKLTLFAPGEPGDLVEDLGLSEETGSNRHRYRGFISNVAADDKGEIKIYVANDTASRGPTTRAWFDGVSYGPVRSEPAPAVPPVGIRLAEDGAWTWFNDPRALFHNGTLYVGYVSVADGKSRVNAVDVEKGTFVQVVESSWAERDDHNNPGLVPLPDGRLMAFYARHGGGIKNYGFRTSLSTTPVTPADWSDETVVQPNNTRVSYQNPYVLRAENNRLYNFMRNLNYNPTFQTSDDTGKTWTTARQLVHSGRGGVRPYVKYASNYEDRIDVLYTDGHPRDVNNSLYNFYIKQGGIFKTDGARIKDLASVPLAHDDGERGSVIYQYSDAPTTNYDDHIPSGRAWSWDIVYDAEGNPVVVFSVQVGTDGRGWEKSRIYYYYARFVPGKGWQKKFIARAGRALYPAESDYAGGICVDPANPRVVYISTNAAEPFDLKAIGEVPLAKNNRYEIFKGVVGDDLSVSWTPVTQNSEKDNLRPYVPRNSPYRESLIFFYGTYRSYVRWDTEVRGIFKDKK